MQFALLLLQLVSASSKIGDLAKAVQATSELVKWGVSVLEKCQEESRDPNAAEFDELHKRNAALRAALHSDTN